MYRTENRRGSITVEASIALPVFICVIVSIIFFIRVIQTHEKMQHAINETAHEIASAGYIYYVSGLHQIEESIDDGIQSRQRSFVQSISKVFSSYEGINGIGEAVDEIVENPLKLIADIAWSFSGEIYEDAKTNIFIPVLNIYIKKYLADGKGDTDAALKRMNIRNGIKGLDFSQSRFFEDGGNDIDIVVRYEMDVPVPFKIFSSISIVQRACVKAWMGGDEGNKSSEEDIWSLNNFQRGRRVRELFGANLPWYFPGISSFDSGTAVLIRSMDLTAKSYSSVDAVKEKVEEYIDQIRSYSGQQQPWGEERIVIKSSEITSRKLVLVIPKNPVEPEIKQALEQCLQLASSRGVIMVIEEYGYKKMNVQENEVDLENTVN